jgi:hypothetical protein
VRSNLPWKEPSFRNTKEESDCQETLEVENSSTTYSHNTPADHDTADPDRRREMFHGEVAWSFKQHVRNEEHCYGNVVAVTSKIELGDDVVGWGIIVQSARIAQIDLE